MGAADSPGPGGTAHRACLLTLYDFAVPFAVEETLRLAARRRGATGSAPVL
jgi:hypothetical protein